MKKYKALKFLRLLSSSASRWEAWLLLLLLVTVFGMAVSAPHGMGRKLLSIDTARVEDPYDLRADKVNSGTRNGIETGL